jgi:hypothetical protein
VRENCKWRSTGGLGFAAASAVAKMSKLLTGAAIFVAAGTVPGQRMKKGTRTPPSKKVAFQPRYGLLMSGRPM